MTTLDPRQCWRTPPELWEKIQAYWGITVDAAADRSSHLCRIWFGPDHVNDRHKDGLSADWQELSADWQEATGRFNNHVYCNPGFRDIGAWLAKAHAETRTRDNIELAVVMAHVQTSAAWWRDWAMKADEILFLTPRVNFVPREGIKMSSNSRDNCLIIYRRGPDIENSTPRIRTWRWK